MTQFKRFLVSYRYDRAQWNIVILAKDLADARERLAALRTAHIDGEIVATIPAHSGWLAPFLAWLRNTFVGGRS